MFTPAPSVDTSLGPAGRLSFAPLSLAIVLAVLAIALFPFFDSLNFLYSVWNLRPEYSHGLMIPIISLFLVWQKRRWLSEAPFTGSWAGVALVATGLFMWLAGSLSTIHAVSNYGFLVVLYGMILALVGWRVFRELIGPLALLLFMVPLPAFITNNLSLQLQLLSSQIGVSLIRLAGISVFVEGNVIDLGTYQLQVAEACDGLRYLFPLMTLGFVCAYIFQGPLWQKAVLFLASIPTAILMNVIRIGVIGITVEHWGIRMAEGFLHEFQGWAVFMVSTAVLLALAALLAGFSKPRRTLREAFAVDFGPPVDRSSGSRARRVPASFLATGVLAALACVVAYAMPERIELRPPRATLAEIPMSIGRWQGRHESLEDVYQETLAFDDYVLANYRTGEGALVNLYSAYYSSQRTGRSAHSPRACLPGGGWRILSLERQDIPVPGRAVPLPANRVVIELGGQRQVVYYWFQQRGRTLTNEYLVKWYIFQDALFRNRTDGALVRLTGFVTDEASEEDADAAVRAFAADLVPLLDRYVPG